MTGLETPPILIPPVVSDAGGKKIEDWKIAPLIDITVAHWAKNRITAMIQAAGGPLDLTHSRGGRGGERLISLSREKWACLAI